MKLFFTIILLLFLGGIGCEEIAGNTFVFNPPPVTDTATATWYINSSGDLAPTNTIDVFAPAQLFVSSSILIGGGITSTGLSFFTNGLIANASSSFNGLNSAGAIAFTELVSCNTIDTNAAGVLVCGVDTGGGGGSGESWILNAQTVLIPSTTVGIIVSASSTINSSLNVAGNLNASSTLFVGGNILPGSNNALDVGAFGVAFRDIYASSSIRVGAAGASSTLSANGNLTLSGILLANSTTATSTLAGGLLVDAGTLTVDYATNRVGINTTTPAYILDISSTGAAAATISLNRRTPTAINEDAGIIDFYNGTNRLAQIEVLGEGSVNNSGAIQFWTASAGTLAQSVYISSAGQMGVGYTSVTAGDRMAVNGNLGVGTSNPGYRLDVVGGDINIAADSYLRGGGEALFTYADGGADAARDAIFGSGDATALIDLFLSAGEGTAPRRLFIEATNGNIGFSTTSPSQRLSVQGGGLISGNLTVAGLTATGTLTSVGLISSASSSIASSLNVSGNLNASSTLFVGGNILPGSNNALDVGAYGAAFRSLYASTTLFIGGTGSLVTLDNNSLDSQGAFTLQTTGVTDLILQTGGYANALFIDDSADNIGIGTTGPAAALEINDTTTNQLRITNNDADGGAVNFADIGVEADGKLGLAAEGTDPDLELRTNAFDNAIVIDNSVVAVGINTDAPDTGAELHIAGGLLATASSTFTSGLNVGGALSASSSLFVNNSIFVNQTAGTFNQGRFFVDSTGNLSASGTITFPNLVSCNTIDTNAAGVLACGADATGAGGGGFGEAWVLTNGALRPTTTVGFISLASSSINSSLNVAGNLNASSTLFVGGALIMTGGSAADNELRTATFDNALYISNANRRVGIGTSTPFATLSVSTTAGTPGFVIGSSTATHFIVDNQGWVGIGVTSPAWQLHVNGAMGVVNDFYTQQSFFSYNGNNYIGMRHTGSQAYVHTTVGSPVQNLNFNPGDVSRMQIETDGDVGIASSTCGWDLCVGNSGINSGQTSFTNTSHSKFKENISTTTFPSDFLNQFANVRIKSFQYTDDYLNSILQLKRIDKDGNPHDIPLDKLDRWKEKRQGILADEFNPLLGKPTTTVTISGDDRLNVMWEAIRQLIVENKNLKARVQALEAR